MNLLCMMPPEAWLPPYVLVIQGMPTSLLASTCVLVASMMKRTLMPAAARGLSAAVTGGALNEYMAMSIVCVARLITAIMRACRSALPLAVSGLASAALMLLLK